MLRSSVLNDATDEKREMGDFILIVITFWTVFKVFENTSFLIKNND